MSPFTIAIIIGFVLIVISMASSPSGFFFLSPLFLIGGLVFFGGIIAHLRKWWARGYD